MEYLKVWTSFRELLEPLTDAERGRLFVAMLEYAESGVEPQLSGSERYVWPSARQSIKRASDENERMKAMGKKGGRPKTDKTYGNLQKPTETYENPYKEKDKEKDNYITTNDSARAHEEDTDFGAVTVDPLIVKIQQELNGLTDTHYNELDGFRDELPDDLIGYAVDSAVGNGVRNWAYVRAILEGFVRDHVRTVGEAKDREGKRKQEKEQKPQQPRQTGKVVSAQRYTQRDYDEAELEERLGVNDLFAADWDGVIR